MRSALFWVVTQRIMVVFFLTDVWGQPIGFIFFNCLTLGDGTDKLPPKCRLQTAILLCLTPQKSADLIPCLSNYLRYYGPGVDSASNRNEYLEIYLGPGNRCLGLTILPSSYADYFKIWEPQPTGTLRACPGLYRNRFTCKKVKVTLVQALRLCTGRMAHRGSIGIALLFHDQRH